MCSSPYRCSSAPEALPRSEDDTSVAEDLVFVSAAGLLWLASTVHVLSAIVVSSAVANGTFGSVASLLALVVVVVLPFLAQKGLSIWEGAFASRMEAGDAVSNP